MDPQRALGGRLVGHLLAKRFLTDFRLFWGSPNEFWGSPDLGAAVCASCSGAEVKQHFGT